MNSFTPAKLVLLLFFSIFFSTFCYSQNPENELQVKEGLLNDVTANPDSLLLNDSTQAVIDSTAIATDSLANQPPPKGDIETTIKYSAKDSINFSVDSKIVKLYGDAKIVYGSIELEAENITIDYAENTLSASGQLDSAGQRIGYPIFKNGNEIYETKDIVYNFKTGRARITEVVTQQGEGYLHGQTVFKNADNELFSINNSYTTCNLADPHFVIRARKTKAIPNDKIVSGPANLEINDVPTLLWLPFGMFPADNSASSGVIIPSYGEESRRGFFLRGGGYFFDVSDYFKATVTGDLYSKGGHGINLNTVYKKRYSFNGNLNFAYTQIRLSDQIEDESRQNDFRLTWSHNPQSKGNSRFSASINAATSTYNQNNFIGINGDPNSQRIDNVTRRLSSNLNYTKTFGNSPFTLGVSARHNQDIQTREVDLLLPSVTLNMGNIYPLASKSGRSPGWMEKLNLRYTMAGTNQITNNLGQISNEDPTQDSIAPFDTENLSTFLSNARRGVRHTIPISTSFKALKHFTASPSLNYEELWYFEQLVWGLDEEDPNSAVVIDTLDGFNRVSTYSVSTSFNTRLYGTYFFKKGRVEAIRHVMNPTISLSYAPDFSDDSFDYFQRLETEDGQELVQSRYQGFVFGSPSAGERGSVGLSLNNTLEMKVKSKDTESDSAATSKKVPIFNNLGLSTSYNVVAEQFKLGNIALRANTSVFNNKLTINFNGSIDPYVYILDSIVTSDNGNTRVFDRRIDRLAINSGEGLGQLSQATIALNTNLNPSARKSENDTNNRIQNSELSQEDKDFLINNPDSYVDFSIPWSLRVSYSLNYRKNGFEESNTTQTLRFSGDVSLTEQWKVTFNSGYDFEARDLTQTTLGISRDLHCWTMNVNWTPFGRFQSYNFTIRVKSSLLQDLKLDRNRSFFDR